MGIYTKANIVCGHENGEEFYILPAKQVEIEGPYKSGHFVHLLTAEFRGLYKIDVRKLRATTHTRWVDGKGWLTIIRIPSSLH
jgi:hypothetical protein